jgi:hypothetical protein
VLVYKDCNAENSANDMFPMHVVVTVTAVEATDVNIVVAYGFGMLVHPRKNIFDEVLQSYIYINDK